MYLFICICTYMYLYKQKDNASKLNVNSLKLLSLTSWVILNSLLYDFEYIYISHFLQYVFL